MLEAEERANQGREDGDEAEADGSDDYPFHDPFFVMESLLTLSIFEVFVTINRDFALFF